VTVTLSVNNGTLAIVPGRALLSGNLVDAVTITGTLAEVNLALANVRYLGDSNFTGSDTLTMLSSDGALSDSDDVLITVSAVADAPQLDLDGSAAGTGFVTTFTEGGPAVALADSDLVLTDVDSPNLVGATFTLINAQAGDTLVVTGTLPGGITADLVGNQLILSGTASVADYAAALALVAFDNPGGAPDPQDRLVEVTVNDGASTASAFTLVHLTVLNDAPVAQDGSASGVEDTDIAGTLVATDVDTPSASLTYSLVAQAAHGTVTVDPDGSYSYTPNDDFNGTDSFTFQASDGALDSNIATVTLTIAAVNDAPSLTLDLDGAHRAGAGNYFTEFTEGGPPVPIADTDTVITDPDDSNIESASIAFFALLPGDTLSISGSLPGGIASSYDPSTGILSLTGSASRADYQTALHQVVYSSTSEKPDQGSRLLSVTVNDGDANSSPAFAIIAVTAVNDAPVAQNDIAVGDEDTNIGGLLAATDVDNIALAYSLVTQAAHGTVAVNTNGTWSYTPNDDFNGTDSFSFKTSDGISDSNTATVTLIVNAVNDAPVNQIGPARGARDAEIPLGGLVITDVDADLAALTTKLEVVNGTITVGPAGGAIVSGNGTASVTLAGTLDAINATLTALGNVLYHPPPGFEGTDTLTITTDDGGATGSGGAQQDIDVVTITVGGQTPTGITLSGSAIDEFSPDGTVIGSLSAIDTDPGDSFTFTLLDDAGTRFAIDGISLVVAHGLLLDFEQATSHPITVQVTDGFGLTFQQDFVISVGNVDPEIPTGATGAPGGTTIIGGPLDDRIALAAGNNTVDAGGGNDVLTGGPGNDRLTGAAGDDTAIFTAPLGSTVPDDFGMVQWIDIAGADGSDRLFSIEHLQFPDGTVHVDDGDLLFDTLFYDHRNPDVFHAAVDARQHYAQFGWHEGRDPNAFLSTSQYLSAYRDAIAADQNPLEHYRDTGWRLGFDPSLSFDTTLYLLHNPDVAAAGVNPLEHFLQFGRAEGRAAYAAIGQEIGPSGFDIEFYLMSNPDVAAAGVDPVQHYEEFGRHEGRNPNRYFDTVGYLARYTDVAAAGVNPLQHYDAFGWREGRDPSGAFDTLDYLAANPDVAAANVNPLTHFLQFGIYEGRDPFGDGVFR
jgi:VCBS repeat-containing protein